MSAGNEERVQREAGMRTEILPGDRVHCSACGGSRVHGRMCECGYWTDDEMVGYLRERLHRRFPTPSTPALRSPAAPSEPAEEPAAYEVEYGDDDRHVVRSRREADREVTNHGATSVRPLYRAASAANRPAAQAMTPEPLDRRIEKAASEIAKDHDACAEYGYYGRWVRIERILRAHFDAVPSGAMTSEPDGVALIAAERRRQVEREGWTPAHDDAHDDGELAEAAATYASLPEMRRTVNGGRAALASVSWPFADGWKPGDRIRELSKAGALIAAEIDRLHRAIPAPTVPETQGDAE